MNKASKTVEDDYILDLAQRAKQAAGILASSSGKQRREALQGMARNLRSQAEQIIEANRQDLEGGRKANGFLIPQRGAKKHILPSI